VDDREWLHKALDVRGYFSHPEHQIFVIRRNVNNTRFTNTLFNWLKFTCLTKFIWEPHDLMKLV